MTEAERAALIAYLVEIRRHLHGQIAAVEALLVELKKKECYNQPEEDEFPA